MKNEGDKRFGLLEAYKKFNKLTLAGSIAMAIFVPSLAIPALSLAALDAGQILLIDRFNKKKTFPKQQVVFQT